MELTIEEADLESVCKIRQVVLWPDKPLNFVRIEEDHIGIHFGVYLEKEIVSVISLFPDQGKNSIRFRKFATLPALQGLGIGTQLLEFVLNYSEAHQYDLIWCDARVNAMDFYLKFGFQKSSGSFLKEDVAYYQIRKILSKETVHKSIRE